MYIYGWNSSLGDSITINWNYINQNIFLKDWWNLKFAFLYRFKFLLCVDVINITNTIFSIMLVVLMNLNLTKNNKSIISTKTIFPNKCHVQHTQTFSLIFINFPMFPKSKKKDCDIFFEKQFGVSQSVLALSEI